jgi:phytol kinase
MLTYHLLKKTVVLTIIFAILNTLFVIALMRARVSLRLQPKISRKIYHICIFTAAWFIQTFFGFYALTVFATVVLLMAFDMLIIKKDRSLIRSMSTTYLLPLKKTTKQHILAPFIMTALGGLLTNIFFPLYAPVGYLVVGWGDAAGSIIGQKFGKYPISLKLFGKFKIKKTIEGSLGVYVFSALAMIVGLPFLHVPFLYAILAAIFFSLVITIVEIISPLHSDNLTIQLVVAFMLWCIF